MLGFQKTFRFLNAALRNGMVPRASYNTNPPKEIVTPVEKGIALAVMYTSWFTPGFWFLAHLEDYKKRPTD